MSQWMHSKRVKMIQTSDAYLR